jgi:protein transport protein SEC24
VEIIVTFQAPTGGRMTVFQSCLPNHGPGLLTAREDPSQRAGKEAPHLNPATDFYKRLALDCSGQQVAVDLFLINSQYSDLATLCKFHCGERFYLFLLVCKLKLGYKSGIENSWRYVCLGK